MVGEEQTDLNKLSDLHIVDMATKLKSIGDFSANEDEEIEEWIERIKMVGTFTQANSRELVYMSLLCLKGNAKSWATQYWKILIDLPFEEFCKEAKSRFAKNMETAEILNRFFMSSQSKSYKEYVKLLKDATTIFNRKCINAESLIKQVIVRSPGDIKSLLLTAAVQSQDWETFVKKAEDSAWIAFPERVVNEVQELHEGSSNKETEETVEVNETRKGVYGTKKNFCRLHGECGHNTTSCEVIKLVEKKGWKRSTNLNKNNFSYFAINSAYEAKSNINSFNFAIINGTKRKILFDTGANISLYPLVWKNNFDKLRSCNTILKSVTGEKFTPYGCMHTEAIINGKKSKINFFVTDKMNDEYAIVGMDWISANFESFVNALLNKQEKKIKVVNQIREEGIFSKVLNPTLSCKVGKHSIKTLPNKEISCRTYSTPYAWDKEIQEKIQELLDLKIIRPSTSRWCSSLVPVKKKDGSLRLCVDYRQLNAITIKDKYPLPNISEILDQISQAEIFSVLDATSGYHQLEMDENDKWKTAFRYKGGFYEYNRMPFGLCNAPATFQRAMDIIMQGINGKYVIPYLDDIIIFSDNIELHKAHLNEVLKRLKEAGITLNPDKCNLYKKEIKVLGRIVSKGTVKPDKEKIIAIQTYKMPETIKELCAF